VEIDILRGHESWQRLVSRITERQPLRRTPPVFV
jgi:hypothetical protein